MGTDADPQDRGRQERTLRDAGAVSRLEQRGGRGLAETLIPAEVAA